MRSLEADSPRSAWIAAAFGGAILLGWLLWAFAAEVPVYAATATARLEAASSIFPLEATEGGRVIAVHFTVGQAVEEGQLLVELDSREELIELEEQLAREEALEAEREAVRREIAVEEEMGRQLEEAGRAAEDEAQARVREARVNARLASDELVRSTRLSQSGAASEAHHQSAVAEAARRRLEAQRLRLGAQRSRLEQNVIESERRARLQRLYGRSAELTAELASVRGRIGRIELIIERRRVRAPAAGLIGETGDLRIGSYVEPGYRVAVVVAEGPLRVVADYPPGEAFGRVEAGQRAELRLDAFPWLHYGRVEARVLRVASEARDGKVRVELEPDPASAPRIPLQHGLPGSLQVEVERVAPAQLVARFAGAVLGSPAPSPHRDSTGEPAD